jgi:hypothetical protein
MSGGGNGNGNAILVVEVELPEADVDEFNRWYREEHGPFKLGLHGYLGLRRFRARDGSARFLALYELETAAAADDPGPLSPPDIETMQMVMSTWKSWKRTVWVEVAE